MENLSQKQRAILEFLQSEANRSGVPPTVREICKATGIKSTSTVHLALNFLAENKYISRKSGFSRSTMIEGIEPSVQVPVLGVVTAGVPILAVEQIEEYIPFSASSARGRDLFALKVRGDSMINAGIIDGDLVVSERTETASNKQIVVALIDDEATVKRFVSEKGEIYLAPENPAFDNIYSDEIQILGKVIASIRSYE